MIYLVRFWARIRFWFGRINSARDLEDTWRRRLSAMTKPAAVLNATLISLLAILVAGVMAVCSFAAAGYSLASNDTVRLARLVEDLVPQAALLNKADLRTRFRSAARAVMIVDETITSRRSDPAEQVWFERILGRPAPMIDPGREAILLGIIDRVASHPSGQRADLLDQMVLWAATDAHREAWAIVRRVGELPAATRRALMDADAKGLEEVLRWLQDRSKGGNEIRSLKSTVEGHRLELGDQARTLQEQIRSMNGTLEAVRARRMACQRHVSAFDTCMTRAPP